MTFAIRRTIGLPLILALFPILSSCKTDEEKEDVNAKKEAFESFKKIFAIGLPGMKDEEVTQLEGVRKLDGKKASSPGLVLKTDAIVTEGEPESLKGVSINGFSKDGVIISARIEINGTSEFLEEIKTHVEGHYKIKFPEAKVDEMNMGDVSMKITTYALEKEGMVYQVSASDGDLDVCGVNIKPVRPKP